MSALQGAAGDGWAGRTPADGFSRGAHPQPQATCCASFKSPDLLLIPLVMFLPATRDVDMSTVGIFALGFLTVAQFSFWGNYLPLVYPTYLRGTGEAFAANIGGRMLGTSAALLVTSWSNLCRAAASRQLAYAAGIVGPLSYAIGFIASFWLPEPSLESTPDSD